MKNNTAWLALLFLNIVAVTVGSTFRYPLVTDDPFITYRYAQNLIDGQGFVYNPGEHLLSTTAPLFSIVLAAFGPVLRDLPSDGFWLSVLGLALCAWFVYLLAGAFESRAAGLVAALLILASPGLILTFGLETGFYLALAFGAAYLYLRGRPTAAFILLALLTLTRNDGLLLMIILAADLLWVKLGLSWIHLPAQLAHLLNFGRSDVDKRDLLSPGNRSSHLRDILRPLLTYCLIISPWIAFAWWWFGTPFPFTLTAKIAQAQSGLWDPFGLGVLKWLTEWLTSMPIVALFALVGLTLCLRSHSRLLLLAVWAFAHLVAYTLLGVAFYAWYVAPMLPVVALFAGIGADRTAKWLSARASIPAARAVLLAVAGLTMFGFEVRADLGAGMQHASPKVQAYRRAAQWIAQNTSPGSTVDALEVGVIGYYDRRPTYDFVGLVDPIRIPYLRSLELANGVRQRSADYVIMIPPDVWLPQDPWFETAYVDVQEIREPGFYSGKPLVIYRRADEGGVVLESVAEDLSFENRVDLVRVDLFSRSVSRGDTLPVVLHLRANEPLGNKLKFTLQLVGTENRIVAQSDTYYPARLPEDGKPFADHQGLRVARNVPAGTFELILAMYDALSGDRSTLFDRQGNEVGDFVRLGTIEIR